MKGLHHTKCRQRGASTVETVIMSLLLFSLLLGAFQGLLLYRAKISLNHAVTEAVRTGAVNHTSSSAMTNVMAEQLSPLYGGWGTGGAEGLATAVTRAKVDLALPLGRDFDAGAGYELQILSPTQEAFKDFGKKVDNVLEIPNHHLRSRDRTIGATSKVNVQDANLLKIRATYGVKMTVPLASDIIATLMEAADPERKHYYQADPPRIPISSTAIARMQSAPRKDEAQLSLKTKLGSGGTGAVPPDDFTEEDAKELEEEITNPGGGDGDDDDTKDDDSKDDDPKDDEEIECDTTWDDKDYSFKDFKITNIFTWDDAYDAASNIIKDFTAGLIEGVGDQANDLIELLKDPTVLWDMAVSIYENGILDFFEQVLDGLIENIKKLRDCGPGDIGKIIGQNASPAAFLKIISKMAKITGNAKLTKYADELTLPCKIRSSFLAGTWVSTPSGMRRIEDIMAGDLVLSRSTVDNAISVQPVTALLGREAPNYHQLNTSVGTVKTTAEHPFWVINKGWTPAKDLQANDRLSTAKGEALLFENGFQDEEARVYNFTVANSHTYFVAASQDSSDGIWVHNAGKATCWDVGGFDLEGKPYDKDFETGRKIYEIEIDGEIRRVYVGKDGKRLYDADAHEIDFLALTDKEVISFRDRIDAAGTDIEKDNIRYERYSINNGREGKTVLDREKWQDTKEQLRKNQENGRYAESVARQNIADAAGETIHNNNKVTIDPVTGLDRAPVEFTINDPKTGKPVTTRPDGIGDKTVLEHKDLSANEGVVYDTAQMRAQREWARTRTPKKTHVVSISGGGGLKDGLPNAKPSGPLGNSNSVVHYIGEDGKPSHTWNKRDGVWDDFKADGY